MSASTDIPLTITPEAAARIAELGMQNEFEQMIEHTRQVVPALAAIEVVRELPYDTDSEPVSITAYWDRPYAPEDNTSADLDRWVVEMFPPHVLEHMHIFLIHGRPHAR